MKDLRMYILVNNDIEISKPKLAGQTAHASSKSGENFITIYACLSPADDYESRMKHE